MPRPERGAGHVLFFGPLGGGCGSGLGPASFFYARSTFSSMSEQTTSPETADQKLWLLVVNGREAGPFPTKSVHAMLRRNEINPATPTRSTASHEWRPLNAWPDFAAACRTPQAAQAPSEVSGEKKGWPFRLICAYCIYVAPLLCLLSVVAMFATRLSPEPQPSLRYTLQIALLFIGWAVILLTGGIRLRRRDPTGLPRVRFALIISVALFSCEVLSWCLAAVFGGLAGADTSAPDWTVSSCGGCIFRIVRVVFELYSLSWLHDHEGDIFHDSSTTS